MVDNNFLAQTAISIAGLVIALGGVVAAIVLPAVPWWVFFVALLVLPATEPVARAAGRHLGDEDPTLKSPSEAGITQR